MMKVTESIRAFLQGKYEDHNGKDLLDFFFQNPGLETQVNVSASYVNDQGKLIQGRPVPRLKSTWTDDADNRWWAIRVPKNAGSEPEFNDYELKWPLELHAEAIGSTGWDWVKRRSLYVAFDFDAIMGHAIGVTAEKLSQVREAAERLPWVERRLSTGGSGIHLYVFFGEGGIPTDNHTEHAALARCVLGLMSAEAGFDFASKDVTGLDACGGNMWLWHRKSTKENRGLALIGQKATPLSPDKIPPNWRDHIPVIKRASNKVRIGDTETYDVWEALASAHRVVQLEPAHKEHIDALIRMGFSAVWVADHHMLQTHTVGFKRLMEKFPIRGSYDTVAKGEHPEQPNCYAFPGDAGSWKIYRFSAGVAEAPTWEQNSQGLTNCWFNRPDTLRTAARSLGAAELKRGGYEFNTLEQAKQVAALLGHSIEVNDKLKERKAVVHATKDGRLTIEVAKLSDDGVIEGWNSSDKKGHWTRVFDVPTEQSGEDITNYDERVRALVTPQGAKDGWAIREDNGKWTRWGASEIKQVLQSYGHSKPDAEVIMGLSVRKAWTVVCKPFQDEYPGDRQWNLNAPQLAFKQALRSEELEHPHWDLILDHIGRDLDKEIEKTDLAREANICTGADYLRAWFACILRDPASRLPYLFLFGDENCGKSILWEAFSLLVTGGVVKADRALTNQSDFNGELAGAILCVVEEKDISKSPGASAKIKDAVTGLTLSIRKMRTDSYQIVNLTHWIQTANHQDACVVPPGDTRIVVIHVGNIEKGNEVPKELLMQKLREEAPAFLRTLLDLPLPHARGRLSLPVINTRHKARSEEFSRTPLEAFIHEQTYKVIGETIPFKDFYDKFIQWMAEEDRHSWTKTKVSRSLPVDHPSGAGTGNQKFIANISWESKPPAEGAKLLITRNGKLVEDNG